MKTIRNTVLVGTALFLMVVADTPRNTATGFQLMSEAHAILGVWRRHARRWAVVGTSVAVASAAAAESAAAATASKTQAAAPPPPAASAPPAAPPPHGSIPLGTVVHKLPEGCKDTPVGGVDYQYCDGNFYRAVFQGNNLVYVTAQP
jgi:hypothetical protein